MTLAFEWLFTSNRQIANVQAEYLNKLHKRGFIIAIATGRAATGVYSHVEKLKIPNMPVVCCNGAVAYTPLTLPAIYPF